MNRLHLFHIASFFYVLVANSALAFVFPAFSRSNIKTKTPIFHKAQNKLNFNTNLRYAPNTKLKSETDKIQELEATADESDWETVLKRDGVLKIESILPLDKVDALSDHVNDQKIMAWFAGQTFQGADGEDEGWEVKDRAFYGEKQSDKVCDLQLNMQRGGYTSDFGKNVSDAERHILADVLLDLFGPSGNITSCYENLVTSKAELVELSALVTEPGDEVEEGKVQSLISSSCELNNTSSAPLYTMILALQDISEYMAPITFFKNTHTASNNSESEEGVNGDALTNSCLSTMKKGDAIIFDGRILFSYNLNDPEKGSTCSTFRVSFKNPEVKEDLGFKGSLRPGYAQAMELSDLTHALDLYEKGDGDSFIKYGDGLNKEFVNIEVSQEIETLQIKAEPLNETDSEDK